MGSIIVILMNLLLPTQQKAKDKVASPGAAGIGEAAE